MLNDPSRKAQWAAAMGLSYQIGVLQAEIYSWAKANIDTIALIPNREALFRLELLIEQFGTKADGERLLRLADTLPTAEKKQADLIRRSVNSIMAGFDLRERTYPSRKKPSTQGGDAKAQNQTPSTAGNIRESPNAAVNLQNPASPLLLAQSATGFRSWLVWLLLFIAAIVGAGWLFLRKAK